MCLAVPGRVLSVSEEGPLARRARVDFGGTVRETNLSLLPEADVGDWVLVHVGIALTRSASTSEAYAYSGGTLTLVDTDSSSYTESNLATLALGDTGAWSDCALGCYRYARYWTAVLNATDIQAEFEMTPSSGTPAARATNLYFSWPLATATDTTDWTGNGRVPTLVGGSTSADEPPIGGSASPAIVSVRQSPARSLGLGSFGVKII